MELAERCGMRLFLTDGLLETCRLLLAQNDESTARDHLARAKALIEETGYLRRNCEVQALE